MSALPAAVVHVATASAVTITQIQHTPNPWYEAAVSVTFTPPIDCVIECTASAEYSYTGTPPYDYVEDGLWWSGDGYGPRNGHGTPVRSPDSLVRSRTFSITGGVSTTINWGMAKFASGDSLVVNECELRVTEVRM